MMPSRLHDEVLFQKPFPKRKDKDLVLYQVVLHVVNHAADHCARLLRSLKDLGVKTVAQDYVSCAYEHP
jgi:hypothetical protein